ncbi:MAG: hypothetical protein ACYC35_17475 [Pirellulales bacterium]|jgi:hypothetical protein
MRGFVLRADDVLRGSPWTTRPAHPGRTLLALAGYVVAGGLFYGGVMGAFGGVGGDRLWQIAYSAAKVPLLLTVTFLISLPSFFVLNTLVGLRSDFAAAVRALAATQAGLTIALAALAPLTAFWYVSSTDYETAILFNAAMFALASFGAQWALRRYYRPLVARNRRHRWLLGAWLTVYAFVGIQMGWILRPFVGDPARPVQFFRDDAWGNAYVVVFRMVWRTLSERL